MRGAGWTPIGKLVLETPDTKYHWNQENTSGLLECYNPLPDRSASSSCEIDWKLQHWTTSSWRDKMETYRNQAASYLTPHCLLGKIWCQHDRGVRLIMNEVHTYDRVETDQRNTYVSKIQLGICEAQGYCLLSTNRSSQRRGQRSLLRQTTGDN